MANIVKVKRSATPAKVPTTSDLQLGEIAVNTYDGKMYIKKDDGTASIVQVGGGAGSGDVAGPSSATDNAITRFDGTTGKTIQNSVVTVSDTGVVAGASISGAANTLSNIGNSALTNSAITINGASTSLGGSVSVGTVTSVTATAGTGISVTGSPITTSGTLTITNTAPDQVVALTQGGATTITGTYPNFTISSVNTTYALATSTTLGLIELGSDTAQTVAANAVTATASRSYALQVNAAGQGVINVPWTDTNSGGTVTSVSGTGTVNGLTLSGTVTTTGNLTLGGTLSGVSLTSQVSGTLPLANGGTGFTTGYRLFQSEFTSNINANTNRTVGAYGSYASAATNTPTTSGILYSFTSGSDGSGDGGQFWQDYVSNNLYLRQRWGGSYGGWTQFLTTTGNAASATTATTATTATNQSGGTVSATTGSFSGLITGASSASTDVNTANDTGSISIRGSASTVASMSFHRTGAYAINMGLGTDNVFRIGGWSATVNAFQMSGAGTLTMAGSVTANSDERIKTNWRLVQDNFVEKLAKIKSGIYDRTDQKLTQAGVSAQSLQTLLPETVIADSNGMLSVAYGNAALVSVIELAKVVQELRKEIAELKSKIKE